MLTVNEKLLASMESRQRTSWYVGTKNDTCCVTRDSGIYPSIYEYIQVQSQGMDPKYYQLDVCLEAKFRQEPRWSSKCLQRLAAIVSYGTRFWIPSNPTSTFNLQSLFVYTNQINFLIKHSKKHPIQKKSLKSTQVKANSKQRIKFQIRTFILTLTSRSLQNI